MYLVTIHAILYKRGRLAGRHLTIHTLIDKQYRQRRIGDRDLWTEVGHCNRLKTRIGHTWHRNAGTNQHDHLISVLLTRTQPQAYGWLVGWLGWAGWGGHYNRVNSMARGRELKGREKWSKMMSKLPYTRELEHHFERPLVHLAAAAAAALLHPPPRQIKVLWEIVGWRSARA